MDTWLDIRVRGRWGILISIIMILVLGAIFSFSASAKIILLFPLTSSPIKSFSSIDYNDDPLCVHNYLIYFKWILFINQLDMG